jgi:hypothetical protein
LTSRDLLRVSEPAERLPRAELLRGEGGRFTGGGTGQLRRRAVLFAGLHR